MAKNSKEFNTKLYAVIVFFLIAAILATITVTTYKSKYTAFSPEKIATAFTETIVNRGDGYNAYKNALISKNYKYGDYIREYYMYPVIYAESNYKPGDSTDDLKGLNDESYMSDKTKNDTGALAGQVIDTMYPYYEQLLKELNGWDNYDVFFTKYFAKLVEVRKEIFGDKYMTDEIMFTALEANVATYGDKLTGTEDIVDENTGIKTSTKSTGVYEKAYGEDYKFTYEVENVRNINDLSYYYDNKDSSIAPYLDKYKIGIKDITEAKTVTVAVKANGETVATQEVNVVKINSSWYVDNTTVDTSELYIFYK